LANKDLVTVGDIVREVPPEDAQRILDWKEARLLRFVQKLKSNGGNREKALEDAGDEWGSPLKIKKKVLREYLANNLYDKAIQRGLIRPDQAYVADAETIPKEKLLGLLTQQALGEKPSYRQEVLRRNADTGLMEVVEVRSNYDEQKAQDLLAKILGLYEEAPKVPNINIGVVIDGMKGWEKTKAEELLVEAHLKMLEAGGPPPEVVEEPEESEFAEA